MIFTYMILTTLLPYWNNPKIHNLGNIGLGGKIHAELAYLATTYIDNVRYNGKNIREEIYKNYEGLKVLDMCCGTGISTIPGGIGVDSSIEMISVAKRDKKKIFYCGNAENFNIDEDIDVITCMFSFHEIPKDGQIKIKKNMEKLAKKEICIVDISPSYKPKKIMLSGEPYLIDYLNNIDDVLNDYEKEILIQDHVTIWKKYIKS